MYRKFISAFDNLGKSQHIDYHSPQVKTTQEGVEIVIIQTQHDLHPDINAMGDLYNPPTTMTPSISATTTLPSYLYEHPPLLLDYD